MPLVGSEPTTPAGERLQSYALELAATGTGIKYLVSHPIRILASIQIILAVYRYFSSSYSRLVNLVDTSSLRDV